MSCLRLIVVAAVLLGSLGCGCSQAGTWRDDPKNWERAFRSPKPPHVVVLHSYYERSMHWSYEFEYCFQIARNPALKEQILSDKELSRLDGFHDCAYSCTPKTDGQYEIWGYDRYDAFRAYFDRKTGEIFLSDCQY